MLEPIRLNPRNIWPDEAKDFTPWLARPENLAILAEALNLGLKFEAQEKNVGQFRADILCRNRADKIRVASPCARTTPIRRTKTSGHISTSGLLKCLNGSPRSSSRVYAKQPPPVRSARACPPRNLAIELEPLEPSRNKRFCGLPGSSCCVSVK